MKRLVWGLMAILYFMTSCVPAVDENVMHVVELTQTAAAYTATPVNTPDPFEGQILSLLNWTMQIQQTQDPVEQLMDTLDASYTVMKASFVRDYGQPAPNKLFLEVRCECARDGACCNVEHTFVEIARAMKVSGPALVSYVPENIHEFLLVCYDHGLFMGTMYVPWPLMKDFINGGINGYQLGGAVLKVSTPAR